MNSDILQKQLEELNLLQCSLMPGETMEFMPSQQYDASWQSMLAAYSETGFEEQPIAVPHHPARFQVRVDGVGVWFEVELPLEYSSALPDGATGLPVPALHVSVRGDEISRSEHEKWQTTVKEKLNDIQDSECVQPVLTRYVP